MLDLFPIKVIYSPSFINPVISKIKKVLGRSHFNYCCDLLELKHPYKEIENPVGRHILL